MLALLVGAEAYQLASPMAGGVVARANTCRSPAAVLMSSPAEAAAKAAWLAKLDNVPSWVGSGSAAPAAAAPAYAPAPAAAPAPSGNAATAEQAAKQAWLAKLDAPTWKGVVTAVSAAGADAVAVQQLEDNCDAGIEAACVALTNEEEAKKAWLARLDAPTWGAVAATVATVSATVAVPAAPAATGGMSAEEVAKQAWLAKLDAPTWGQASTALTEIAAGAVVMQDLTEKCDAGVEEACATLSSEEAAKQAWLARLDAPTWGAVNSAVSTVATTVAAAAPAGSPGMSAEDIAKQAWLAARE